MTLKNSSSSPQVFFYSRILSCSCFLSSTHTYYVYKYIHTHSTHTWNFILQFDNLALPSSSLHYHYDYLVGCVLHAAY